MGVWREAEEMGISVGGRQRLARPDGRRLPEVRRRSGALGRRRGWGWWRVVAAPAAGVALLLALLGLGACNARAPAPDAGSAAGGDIDHSVNAGDATPGPLGGTLADAVIVNTDLAHMTLDEKLGQLFLVRLIGPTYTPANAAMVEELHAGGILLYQYDIPTFASGHALIATADAHASVAPFVAIDEEGGWVDRLQPIYGFRPSAAMIAVNGSTNYARSEAARAAHDMMSLGFNLDLAPDVDVALVDGPDQSTRTFGATPAPVIRLGGAYLDGLQSNGIIGCLKHFPGLGAATIDAHRGLPLIGRTRAQIEQVELAPYRALIRSDNPGCVMTTDLLMPAFDPVMPAELSPAIVDGVLRGELGYDGVVVTDALYMAGISQRYSLPEAGVLAILAGDDFLMGPWSPEQMRAMLGALKAALASGRLTLARIDQSVRRLLQLKLRFGLLARPRMVIGSGLTGVVAPAEAVALPRRDDAAVVSACGAALS
jgi:beta-N-acetylhexosaminidase